MDERYKYVKKSNFFDKEWYKKNYKIKGDSIKHYCEKGYLLGYDPSPKFNHIKYELIYDDVRYVKANPVWHFEKYGKYESKFLEQPKYDKEILEKSKQDKKIQDINIKKEYSKNIENLIVFLVPEIDTISGGVMSINSIAKITKNLKSIHNSEVIICTMPSKITFSNYTKFKSSFNIYRFEQLPRYFKKLKNVTFHIPEIYVHPFLYFLTPNDILWIKSIEKSKANILNQNVDYMPRPRLVNYLKSFFNEITITCAHTKYCTSQYRTSYDASVHLFSTSNMVKYKYVNYEDKENLLLYSIDDHPMKQMILENIKSNFPELKMVEIKDLKYKDYLKLIGKAKWMITFGEGIDGYFSESIRSGTLAFAVYNISFFDKRYDSLCNIYQSYNDLNKKIVSDMKKFDNKNTYKKIVDKCFNIDKEVYNDSEYVKNIEKYYKEEYTYPIKPILDRRKKLLERKPLVSIALASYNGEKYITKQINSLLNLDYSNIEIIVSDDNSTDSTYKILEQYKDKIKLYKNEFSPGLNGNFVTAISHCNGEYIALCDQDDIWCHDKIDILLEHIDEFDIVHGAVNIIDENDDYHPLKYMHTAYEVNKTNYYNFEDYIRENAVLGCTTLIKSKFLKKNINIPNKVMYHDWWYVLKAIKNGNGIAYVDEEVIKYRQHGNNTAYNTFNSNNWFDKKIAFNNVIREEFNLTDYEKKLINIDTNYNLIEKILKKYIGNDAIDFCDRKYYSFSDDMINDIKVEIENEKM